jgi:hypothetical protein
VGGLIDCPDLEDLRGVYFELCWQQHGGGGLNVTITELEEMGVEEILWYLERARKQREREADALKGVSGSRPRGRTSRPIARARPPRRR